MKLFKLIIKYQTIIVLLLAVYLGIMFAKTNTNLQAKISVLNHKYQELENQNKVLLLERENLYETLKLNRLKIEALEKEDEILTNQNLAKSKEIEKIKRKYESTNNRAANYTSDSIRRYFANF